MSFAAGTRLGHYEIVAPIGAGGMGEVYKARDPRLNRTVAIKVLLQHLSDNPDARARFEREAQTIAGLNHPHICVLHDIGQHEGTDFLVMEFLEGETLARRLERGALAPDQALKYAIEIADALDKAHRHGTTHRDLKPGNIMLTKSGVKLLDFGLAKLRQSENVSTFSTAPTNADVTAPGTILGTLQYMAPEQLEGADVDARTDIFAFGSVLYEMITGRKAFEGKSQMSLIGAILKDTPKPVSALQLVAPPSLDRLLATCLAKDPEDRWQTAHDLWRELKWIAEDSTHLGQRIETKRHAKSWRRVMPYVLGGLAGALIAGAAAWTFRPNTGPATSAIVRLTVPLPPGQRFTNTDFAPLAFSSTGTQLAYLSGNQLHVRAMDGMETKTVPGTEGAWSPFFSPDGQEIGFFAQGKVKKVPVSGGAPLALCDAPGAVGGGYWGPDGMIYFAPGLADGIWRVSSAGGTPQRITTPDRSKGELFHAWPRVLPGAKAVLFTVMKGLGWDEGDLHLQILATGERRVLVRGGSDGVYVSSGHLVYFRPGTQVLMAVPFDPTRLEVTGSPASLPERVDNGMLPGEGVYAVSDSGVLAYLPTNRQQFERRLVWVDRQGTVEPLMAPVRPYSYLSISPDGNHAAVQILGPTHGIWIYDFSRNTLTPLSTGGTSELPTWTPDGKRIAYRASRKGLWNMLWRAADGSGDEEPLMPGSEALRNAWSWTPDGKWLAFQEINSSGSDTWLLPLDGERKAQPFLKTPSFEWAPRFSPDGRWLAYSSNESSRFEIYVRLFPGPGANSQVSTDGGTLPVWSRDGRELFYVNNEKIMSVAISTQPSFKAGSPRLLFEYPVIGELGISLPYDISPDGRRFLMIQPVEPEQTPTQINVVINWFEELKRLVPPGR